MTSVLYVEGSLCMETGQAGWGAMLSADDCNIIYSGVLAGNFEGAVVLMELHAVKEAVQAAAHPGAGVTIAMRSTAALAVLRWVFPEAPMVSGEVEPPKRLKTRLKDAQCLYDLHDIVEKRGLKVSLGVAETNYITGSVAHEARSEMERARGTTRRAAR